MGRSLRVNIRRGHEVGEEFAYPDGARCRFASFSWALTLMVTGAPFRRGGNSSSRDARAQGARPALCRLKTVHLSLSPYALYAMLLCRRAPLLPGPASSFTGATSVSQPFSRMCCNRGGWSW